MKEIELKKPIVQAVRESVEQLIHQYPKDALIIKKLDIHVTVNYASGGGAKVLGEGAIDRSGSRYGDLSDG